MFRLMNVLINYKMVLTVLLVYTGIYTITNSFFNLDLKNGNGGIIFVLLAMNLILNEKKLQNNIIWALPLKRTELWLAFVLRLIIISILLIATDTLVNIISGRSYYKVPDLFQYVFMIILTINIYSFRALKTVFSPKKRFSQFFPILMVSMVIVLSIVIIAVPSIVSEGSVLSKKSVGILGIINIIYSIGLSYYATIKTKSLLYFRAG